jgi:hypothetical protein
MTKKIMTSIMKTVLDMRPDKLRQVISEPTLVAGLWGTLAAYGVPRTPENHAVLVDFVEMLLVGGADLEYDWTERQYANFVTFDPTTI